MIYNLVDRTDRDKSRSKELSPLLVLFSFPFSRLPELLVHGSNEAQDLVSPHFFYGAGNKMLRQELPCLAHLREKVFDVGSYSALVLFVGLGKDETKGNAPFA